MMGGLPGASPLPSLAEEVGGRAEMNAGMSAGMNAGMSAGMVPGTTNTLAGGTVLPLSRSNVMLMNIPEGDESTAISPSDISANSERSLGGR